MSGAELKDVAAMLVLIQVFVLYFLEEILRCDIAWFSDLMLDN